MPDHIPFLNNSDPECAKQFGFNPELKALALFTPAEELPFVLREELGTTIERTDIIKFVLNSMSLLDPYWNERSSAGIVDYALNALFYVETKHPDPSDAEAYKRWQNSWQMKLMKKLMVENKEAEKNEYITILVSYDDVKAYEESVRDRSFKPS